MTLLSRREMLVVSTGILGLAVTGFRTVRRALFGTNEEKVCNVSDLAVGRPRAFKYLHDDLGPHFIVRLPRGSRFGMGPDKNIVAYNAMSFPIPPALDERALRGIEHAGGIKLPQVKLTERGGAIFANGFYECSDLAASAT